MTSQMSWKRQAASAALVAFFAMFGAACGGGGGNPPPADTGTDAFADAAVDAAPVCTGTETVCGDTCVDVMASADHCGACDNACTAPDVCSAGACTLTCPATQEACDGACFDLPTSNTNCGACGASCGAGEVCSAGACTLSCASGLDDCGGSCRDLQTDRANCGACGTACGAGEVCSAGACTLSCASGLDDCGGSCRDLQTDRANCGACGTACGAGEVCSAGACTLSCASGLDDCAGSCRDLQTDRANCGACGTSCTDAEFCQAGACITACSPSLPNRCGGVCTDSRYDEANCGGCGTTCGTDELCLAGACTLPASCAEILAGDPTSPDGDYTIDPDGAGAIAPLLVHCDMTSDGGVGYTMVRIDDAALASDQRAYAAACAAIGMEVIVPRTRAHAAAIRAYNGGSPPNLVNVFPKTNGARGLANWEGECQGTRGCSFYLSNSDNGGCLGFEPNGDNNIMNRIYLINPTACDYGHWNDANNTMSITGYVMCSPNDVGPALQPTCNGYMANDSVSNVSTRGISGVYTIDPAGDGTGFGVQCDMTTAGGGWTLGFLKNSADQDVYGNFGAADTNLPALATWPVAASSAAAATPAAAGWLDLNAFDYTTLRVAAYENSAQTYMSNDIVRTELRIAFGEPGYLLWGPENANAYYWCGGPHEYTDNGVGQINQPMGAPADCKGHGSLGSGWDFSAANTANSGLTLCGSDQSNWMYGRFAGPTVHSYPTPGAAQAIWVR